MKNKAWQYDNLKTVATVLVVIAHATRMYTGRGVVIPARSSEFLRHVTDVIYSFHMPLFMCISGLVYGMCIEDLGKYTDFFKFMKNKAYRLLIPYVAFGLFYVAPVMTFLGFAESYVHYSVYGILLASDSRHLWYLLSLFSVFFLFGIFKKVVKNTSPVILFAFFAFCSLLSGYTTSYFSVSYTLGNMLYFYMGYYINRNFEKIAAFCGQKHIIAMLLLSDCVLYVFLRSYFGVSILLAVTGILLTLGFMQSFHSEGNTRAFAKIIKKDGMGIYLFHPMIIYILFYYFGNWDIHPLLLTSVISVFAFALSILLTELLRTLHMQILLGEGKTG